jgi:hypothetical protein
MSYLVEVYPEERGSAVVIGKKLYWLAILAPENLSSGRPCPKIKLLFRYYCSRSADAF